MTTTLARHAGPLRSQPTLAAVCRRWMGRLIDTRLFRPRRRSMGRWGVASVVIAVAGLSACSSSGSRPSGVGPVTTAAATTSTTTEAQLDASIVSQWLAAERASVAAAKDPGNQALVTILVDYFVDPALSFQRNEDAAYARDGLTNVGDIDNGSPRVLSLTASQAVVSSCTTNRLALIYKATGKPVPGTAGDPAPTQNGVRSTMVLTPSGIWKLSSSVLQEGSCAGF